MSKKRRSSLFNFGLKKDRNYFVENLSTLLSAGIDVYSALSILQKDMHSKRMKEIIDIILKKVESGSSLYDSMKDASLFPGRILSLVRIGEQSGNLVDNLQTIVRQQEKEAIFRSKARSSILYAVVVFSLTLIVGVGSMWFVLPKISETFKSLDVDLPWITSAMLGLGEFLGKYGYIFVPLVIIFIIFAVYFLFSFPKTKFIGHIILLRVPGIKQMIKQSEIAQFGFTLGTLLKSGIPIVDAIDSIREATTYRGYRQVYTHLRDNVKEGESIQKSFEMYKKSEKYIPLPIQQILIAAERSGNLSKALLKVGEKYELKLEATSRDLATILEPMLLIFVGLGIAAFALSVFMPIYSYINTF